MKGSPPRAVIASERAWINGSEGTLKGSFTMMTQRSASPAMSTPSQKESVPKSTDRSVFLNLLMSIKRSSSPCFKGLYPRSLNRASKRSKQVFKLV